MARRGKMSVSRCCCKGAGGRPEDACPDSCSGTVTCGTTTPTDIYPRPANLALSTIGNCGFWHEYSSQTFGQEIIADGDDLRGYSTTTATNTSFPLAVKCGILWDYRTSTSLQMETTSTIQTAPAASGQLGIKTSWNRIGFSYASTGYLFQAWHSYNALESSDAYVTPIPPGSLSAVTAGFTAKLRIKITKGSATLAAGRDSVFDEAANDGEGAFVDSCYEDYNCTRQLWVDDTEVDLGSAASFIVRFYGKVCYLVAHVEIDPVPNEPIATYVNELKDITFTKA